MLRKILLFVSLAGLVIIAMGIKKPFWQNEIYFEKIAETQREGSYLPYRIRKMLWNKTVIIKTLAERVGNLLWFGNFWGIGAITIWRGVVKKRWREILLFGLGVALIGIEDNPNPGYYFWFLLPNILWIWF